MMPSPSQKYEWCVTGHRPEKLFEENPHNRANYERLVRFAADRLTARKARSVITGMALGWDMAIAEAAGLLQIPYLAAVPCEGQESRWPGRSQDRYNRLLQQATEVIILAPKYHGGVMHARNRWMVDNVPNVLALWDGVEDGGTSNTVLYAREKQRHIVNSWNRWEMYR